ISYYDGRHGRTKVSTHVVSGPAMTTLSALIDRMRSLSKTSPGWTTAFGVAVGIPSTTADHGGPPTMPLSVSRGRGGGATGAAPDDGVAPPWWRTAAGWLLRRKGSFAANAPAALAIESSSTPATAVDASRRAVETNWDERGCGRSRTAAPVRHAAEML